MKQVSIYTDGACHGNPGSGGWCAILEYKSTKKTISGRDKQTTNNRMELTAVIEALSALKEPCSVTVTTDSRYVFDAISNEWVHNWETNGWRRSNKRPVSNIDLWTQIVPLLEIHDVTVRWVKGHSGHPQNEMCDHIATSEAAK